MNNSKFLATVLKEEIGYSATIVFEQYFISTEGEDFEELKEKLLEALNLSIEEESNSVCISDIHFEFDLESFFTFYNVINAKALSERIGMNQSLLSQYIKGKKKPSKSQLTRILEGIHQLGREISDVKLLMG